MRLIITLLVLVMPASLGAASGLEGGGCGLTSGVAERYFPDGIVHPVEGLWRMGGDDGALVAIVLSAGKSGTFEVTLLDSPRLDVLPGTVIGSLETTGAEGTFQARFKKDRSLGRPLTKNSSHDFIAILVSPGRMTFRAFRKGKKISLWRWFPYLFRVTVVENANRPENIDGAVKVYPGAPDSYVTL